MRARLARARRERLTELLVQVCAVKVRSRSDETRCLIRRPDRAPSPAIPADGCYGTPGRVQDTWPVAFPHEVPLTDIHEVKVAYISNRETPHAPQMSAFCVRVRRARIGSRVNRG